VRTFTVICPVYNEAEVIGEFHNELARVLDGLSQQYEAKVLYVVDRSSDNSLEILRGLASTDKRIQILALSARFGHQMSLVAGIDHAQGDAVLMMDSDLQHPPALLPELLASFEKGYDIVYTIRRDRPEIGLFKRLSSRLFYRVINWLSTVPVNESAADFRLISRRVADVFRHQIRERNQFLRGLFSWVGFKSVGVPFQVDERRAGKSKYSLARLWRFGMNGVMSFSKRPLHASVALGFLFAGFGLVNAALTLVEYFRNRSLPSGWTTLTILISIFSGVQLISLGIVGEYVGAIFDEVKGRPHYLVDDRVNLP
jgi:glycosyltransferase involved in cell wall biosynthesis